MGCISHFSVALIKYWDHNQAKEERVYLGLQFQGGTHHHVEQ